MKKIPRLIATKVAAMQSDTLYERLREHLCNTSCSRDIDNNSISCTDCIVLAEDREAKKDFIQFLNNHGINLSIVRSM